jgi:hypothetical protein
MQLIFGPKVDIQHFSSPLPTTGLNTMHLTTIADLLGPKVDIQHFNVSLANNWPPQYYAPHYYATDLWLKSGYSTFLMSSCQQLASSILCTHYYLQLIFGPGGYSTF